RELFSVGATDVNNLIPSKPAPTAEPLLVGKPWERCSMSRAHWDRLRIAGKVPAAIPGLGRKELYRRRDLEVWVELGCPAQDEFEAQMAQSRRLTKSNTVVSSG